MTTPQDRGRYPGFDVLELAGHWDEVTRKVVLARVHDVPPIRFFEGDEIPIMRTFCDTVLAQDAEPRVPVLEMVDAKLHARQHDGFRYAGMPEDGEVFKLVARGLGTGFVQAPHDDRVETLTAMSKGELDWDFVDAKQAWKVCMRIVLGVFYSHPWAWNEIGFPGPAYPRGYSRLGVGMSESWEPDPEPQRDHDPVRERLGP